MRIAFVLLIIVVITLASCVPSNTLDEPIAEQTVSITQSAAPTSSPSASPTVTDTMPGPKPTVEPKPDETEEPAPLETQTNDEYNFVEYYAEAAENCRTVVDGFEYYLDTDYYIFQDYFPEFPLFMKEEGGYWPYYLGTTGFWFQVNGDYIYIKSDVLQEDWPDGTLTRVVNLVDGTIKPIERNIDIFIPSEGNKVYYDWWDNRIFCCDQSLEVEKVIEVELPDLEQIAEQTGEDLEWYEIVVNVIDVKNGWIYFGVLSLSMKDPDYTRAITV